MLNASNNELTDQGFYIADWFVEPASCQIQDQNKTVHLEPKVMDLLVYLAQHPGQVHSREDLLDHVWIGVVVSDEALTNAIIKIRKAFNESAKNPKIIETLPKRGYRLIAKVRQKTLQSSSDSQYSNTTDPQVSKKYRFGPWPYFLATSVIIAFTIVFTYTFDNQKPTTAQISTQESGLTLPDKPSIAVLPFVNTGNEIEHAYFSDGMTDDLITDLSKLSGLFVISRNSTFQYKGRAVNVKKVAKSLGVQFILQGSVRRSAEMVRINTQLIDGLTGRQLWAERYDGNLGDVFKLQDRVTGQIIRQLALQLTEQDQRQINQLETTSPEAYDEYLKGWERHWRVNREDFAQAEIHFKKALKLDPGFSRAHAALALIYWQSWQQKWHQNSGVHVAGWIRAQRDLDKVTYPMPLVHSLRSSMQLYNRRYDEAVIEAQRAVTLNPSDATGYLALAEAMVFSGQSQQAIDQAKKAFRLDPNFPAPYLYIEALALFDLKHYEPAIRRLHRVIEAKPGFNEAHILLIAAYGQSGRVEDAGRILETLNQQLVQVQLPELTIDWQKDRWPFREASSRDHFFNGLKKAQIPEW